MEGDTGAGVGGLFNGMGSSRHECGASFPSGELVVGHRNLRRSNDFLFSFFISCLLRAFKIERT
jgi:hypothetical protein